MSDTHDPRRSDIGQDDVQRTDARTTLEERTYTTDVRPAGITRTISSEERRDRVRWGPLWAGLVVALAVNALLQLALVTLSVFGNSQQPLGLPDGVVYSAIAALIAFFVGGLVTGAGSMWRNGSDGVFQGVVLWALAVVAVLLLSILGSGLAIGAASSVTTTLGIGTNDLEQDVESIDQSDLSANTEEAAGAALIGLTLTLVATVAGAAAGSKMWPSKDRGSAGHLDTRERTVVTP